MNKQCQQCIMGPLGDWRPFPHCSSALYCTRKPPGSCIHDLHYFPFLDFCHAPILVQQRRAVAVVSLIRSSRMKAALSRPYNSAYLIRGPTRQQQLKEEEEGRRTSYEPTKGDGQQGRQLLQCAQFRCQSQQHTHHLSLQLSCSNYCTTCLYQLNVVVGRVFVQIFCGLPYCPGTV